MDRAKMAAWFKDRAENTPMPGAKAMYQATYDLLTRSQWISVEERLPKKITNKVLVCCKNGYIGFGHYEKFQGVEDWYNLENGKPFREWDLEDCETYEVTHWMPLPEPPEGGAE